MVAFAALVIAWWRIPPSVPVVESVTQLTDNGGTKAGFVSDGSRIYFNELSSGNSKIAQVSVTGGPTAPVETRFANSYIEGVAHDGSALLVAVGGHNDAEYPLWSIPLPAGEPRRFGGIETQNVDLFPDGRIVFSKFTRGTDIKGTDSRTDWFIADKDGLNPRKLISFPGYVGAVSVGPDGQRILLSQEVVDDRRLLDIAVDGTGRREIRKLSPDEYDFSWTPDEKYLVYQSGDTNHSDIWVLPMQTGLLRRPGKPIRLTNGPLPYSLPVPSRDGKQIFVLGTKQRGELVRYDMKSEQFVPFLSGISATDPTFSRDGKWLAYVSYPDHTLWRSRIDGMERMQLTFPPMVVVFPFISPDGTRVAFHTDKNEVFVISMDGGLPQRAVEKGFYASWSPDGNYLVSGTFSANGGYGYQITDLRTGKTSAVPSGPGLNGVIWLTQDTLVFRNEKATNLLTFDLKTHTRTDVVANTDGNIPNWMPSPDGKYLYFATGGAEPKVMRLRVADHQIETITSLKDLHRALNNGDTQINVAPDGSPIFTRDTGYQEIYALNIRWP